MGGRGRGPNYRRSIGDNAQWLAPEIDNPEYVGEWAAKQIPNPAYFETQTPAEDLDAMNAVAIEIWTMSKGMTFDNFYISSSLSSAKSFAEMTFLPKAEAQRAALEFENNSSSFFSDIEDFLF